MLQCFDLMAVNLRARGGRLICQMRLRRPSPMHMRFSTNTTAAKPLSVWLASILFVAARAMLAQDNPARLISDPEQDYALSPNPEFNGQADDELLRLDLDVYGTGRPVVFLTTKKFGSRSGYTWTAYDPVDDGKYRRIDYTQDGEHSIQFRTDFYYVGAFPGIAQRGALLAMYPGKGEGDLVRFQFENGSARLSRVRKLNYSDPEDQKLFEALFKRPLSEPASVQDLKTPPYRVLSASEIKGRTSASVARQSVEAGGSPTPSTSDAASPSQATSKNNPNVAQNKSFRPLWPWISGTMLIIAIVVTAVGIKRRN